MQQVLSIAKRPHIVVSMVHLRSMNFSTTPKTMHVVDPLCCGITSVLEYVGGTCASALPNPQPTRFFIPEWKSFSMCSSV